jgi:rhodanese-related sulfurtransferase/DNA-binding transcriptional ArsR family regulator
MSQRAAKDRLYTQLARLTQALASPVRLEMLDLLAQRERTVESLADELALSPANASKHLMVLREAHLVEARRDASFVHMHLANDAIPRLLGSLRGLALSQLADLDRAVEELLSARDPLDPIGRDELLTRLHHGDVVVLDVRPEAEYLAGHLPGARCVPVEALERRLAELPRDREVVAYCRGPWCVYAYDAVAILRAHGLRARRLEDGFPEWRSAGLPVEASS